MPARANETKRPGHRRLHYKVRQWQENWTGTTASRLELAELLLASSRLAGGVAMLA